jgi:osmotically inducible lipoprotein OsmB
MKRITFGAAALLLLGACGTTTSQRGLSGAAIGAGIGLAGGPVGVATGAALGAGVGAFTDADDFNLGDPVWD